MSVANLTTAYSDAGFELANPRNHWSAQNEDGRVALTVWADEISKPLDAIWSYELGSGSEGAAWRKRPGQTVRTRHIADSIARGFRKFEIVLCRAKDPKADPRTVQHAEHWKRRIGVIREGDFDADTGSFRMTLEPTGG